MLLSDECDLKSKRSHDPMWSMQKYVDVKRKVEELHKPANAAVDRASTVTLRTATQPAGVTPTATPGHRTGDKPREDHRSNSRHKKKDKKKKVNCQQSDRKNIEDQCWIVTDTA